MAAKSKFDPRKMMEKAIEVMRSSVAEKRSDGKPNPLVGAVLVRPDGKVETASRGELREGNHAEFTLLERKCFGENLDGGVLFATLEPCLNRNHPKRGCARHIVSARIKEVWVGIEDDNPTVAGKGVEHLRLNGVTVHMFDRDLQEIILAENKEFFEWARVQTGESEPEPIKLSRYEDPLDATVFGDLSEKALKRYRTKAGIKAALGSPEFARLLRQQGIIAGEGEGATPTGFGFLLFGKQPRNAVPQAGVLARAELPDGSSTRSEFGQAMVLVPGELEDWLNKILPSTLDRSRMERSERVDLPFEMIREAVVNALIHRDYDITGQKCQLIVTADSVTIKSPGGPISPITLEEMRSFTAPMKSRNPVLHYVFARMGMAEEQGYGLTSLKKRAEALGLPLPEYEMEGDLMVLTIFRSGAGVISKLSPVVRKSLNEDEKASWAFISGRDSIRSPELMEEMNFDERKAQRVLKKLQEVGLLQRIGRGPSTRYEGIR